MTTASAQTTNLFPYLVAEEQHHDHQAEEALFLTFNVDLGYFEARLLGLVRATGARITVIADAGVWAPDIRAVRHAGRSYQLGLVDQPSAFHPKLMVLVGPKRAIASVGSGNLTMGGWQYNRELLTVFSGDVDGMPIAFGGIRDALSVLAASSALDPVTAEGLARTIRRLDSLLDSAPHVETGHRVHASWNGALIEQLPTGPVAELYLSAAFHDPNASAVRTLLARMQPRRVEVAVQPGWTHLNPAALDRVLTEFSARTRAEVALLQDPDSPGAKRARYRHGKLIEWVTLDGERYAMTGSPNLSTVALLKRPADGGNHELAVAGPVTDSLFPGGEPLDPGIIPDLTGSDETAALALDRRLIRVISAVTSDDRLTVQVGGVSDGDVTVEVSHRNDHPDHWDVIGVIPPYAATGTFDTDVPGGSRVRASTLGGGATTPMFVSDQRRVLMRSIPEKYASKTRASSASDLFGDDLALLDLIQGDLTAYAQDVTSARLPTAAREGEGERADYLERTHDRDRVEPWLWLQDDTVRRYGPRLASWLLALPRLADTESGSVPWIDIITDEQAVGLDTDESATEVDENLTSGEVEATMRDLIDHGNDVERLKAARRRWVVRATAVTPSLSIPSRLLILRIALAFWTAGNWDERDPEPFTLTRDLVRTLNIDNQPEELADRAASLAAIALTVMRQRTDVTIGTEETIRYSQARDAARPLLVKAAEESIDFYVTGLRNANGGALTSGHVTETLEDLVGDDPLAELQAAMEAKGFDIHRPAPTFIHIHKAGGNAELSALEAVGFAHDHDGIVVWATTDQGRWACIGWRAPDLVSVFNFGAQVRWRHQRLLSGGPEAAARAFNNAIRSGEGLSRLPGVINRLNYRMTPEAAAVLALLGVESPHEPPCCSKPDPVGATTP